MQTLKEICEVITCGVAKRPEYVEEGFPFLSSKNVKENRFILKHYNYVSEEDFRQLTKHNKPENGDILYTRVGSYGEAAIVDLDFEFAIFVSLTLIKPNPKLVYNRYLMHYLNSPKVRFLAENSTSGIGVKNLNVGAVREFPIHLPTLKIQQKIAALLDEADRLRQLDKELIKKYEQLSQSLFLEMFGDPVSNSKGWDKKKLGELCNISSGSTPSRKNEKYFKGNIPWIKTSEVNFKIIIDTNEKITQDAIDNSSCRIYPKGSIVIAMYGQGKTRGRVGILGLDATTNQACAILPPSSKMNYTYLFQLLKFSYQNLRELGRGGNQPNLNSKLVKSYSVINPPMDLQKIFEGKIQNIEQQKILMQEALHHSEELFNSLLQRAFKGGLV